MRPALAEVLAVVCCDTHCAGWWRAEIAAGMRVECDSRGASTPTATVPWAHATPAAALAAIVEAELLPAHWCDPERAPRWWCERCQGNERGDDDCWDSCDSGALEAPPSHAALVAVASLGADTLARAEAIVAETWRARVVWRAMGAEKIREHRWSAYGPVGPPRVVAELLAVGAYPLSRDGDRVTLGVEALPWLRDLEVRLAWDLRLPIDEAAELAAEVRRRIGR